MTKSNNIRERLHAWRLMRKDHGRHRHTDWRFLFAWLIQTLAAAAFFAVSLGAFVSCGWGVFSYMALLPDPESLPMPQGHESLRYVSMAVRAAKAMCGQGFASCIIFWLVLFMVLVMALSVLLNRLAEACRIRRYDA